MKLVTTKQMRQIEDIAINYLGIPSIVLMENAARTVADECSQFNNILIFAGKGNNGGDGVAIARHLIAKGKEVTVVFVGKEEKATPDCKTNLDILNHLNANVRHSYTDGLIEDSDLVIDAIIGTGLKNKLSAPISKMVDIINRHAKYIIAVDCPTGINSDTGEICGTAIRANKTITFHAIKVGLLLYPASELVGEISIGNLSIPDCYTNTNYHTLSKDKAYSLLPKRPNYSNKGTFGKAYLFAGSNQMTGASVIAATGAYKIGCGLVNACVVGETARVIHTRLPEAVTTILPDTNGYFCLDSFNTIKDSLDNASAIALGCGIGVTPDTIKFVEKMITTVTKPMIIDADGLNAISHNVDILLDKKAPLIITPHLGEMSRLIGEPISYIQKNLINVATSFSKKYNLITVLKDSHTVIANPDGEVYINTTGTSAMSKAGSGDGLCGVMLGLLAQNVEPFESAILASYLCGLAGEITATCTGEYSMLILDLLNNLDKGIDLICENQ